MTISLGRFCAGISGGPCFMFGQLILVENEVIFGILYLGWFKLWGGICYGRNNEAKENRPQTD